MTTLTASIRVALDSQQAQSESERLRRTYAALTADLKKPLGDIAALRELERARTATVAQGEAAQRLKTDLEALRASTAGPAELGRAMEAARERVAALRGEVAGLGSAGAAGGPAALQARLAAVVTAALAARQALDAVRSIVASGLDLQSQENRLAFVFGGAAQGARELEFARAQADRLGLAVKSAVTEYANLGASARGAGLSLSQQREIFLAIAEAGTVLHLSNEQVQNSFRAVAQMAAKGTIQAEEWRGQLAEALPIAADAGMRAIGRTSAEFSKLLESGSLRSADFLPKFAAALREQVADAVGKAADSDQAALQRLENRWERFKQQIASSGLLTELSRQVERIGAELDRAAASGELQRVATGIAQALGEMIRALVSLTKFLAEHRQELILVAEAYAAIKIGGVVSDAGRLAIALAFGRTALTAAEGLNAVGLAGRAASAGLALAGTALRAVPYVGVALVIAEIAQQLYHLGDASREAARAAREEAAALARIRDENRDYGSFVAHTREEIAAMTAAQREAYGDDLERSARYQGAAAAAAVREGNTALAQLYTERLHTVQAAQVAVREVNEAWAADEARLANRVAAVQRGMLGELKTRYAAVAEALDRANKDLDGARSRREQLTQAYLALDEKLAGSQQSDQARAERRLQRELAAAQKSAGQAEAQPATDGPTLQALGGGARSVAAIQSDLERVQKAREAGPSVQDLQRMVEQLNAATTKATASFDKADIKRAALKEQELRSAIEQAFDAGDLDAGVLRYMTQQAQKLAEQLSGVERAAAEKQAADLNAQLEAIKAQAQALKDTRVELTPTMDPNDLDAIRAQIEQKLSGIKVTVTAATKFEADAQQALGEVGLPAKAAGGLVTGPGTGTSDSVLMWGSHGEYMLRAAAVQHYGTAALDALNAMRMPKFAAGGLVSLAGASRSALSGFSPPAAALPAPGAAAGRAISITLPGLGTYEMTAVPRVADDLMRAAAKFGGLRG